MTQLTGEMYLAGAEEAPIAPMVVSEAPYSLLRRPLWLPLPFIGAAVLAGISWLASGMPMVTDAAFIVIAAWSLAVLLFEILFFSRRFGLGGIVFFGGILVWFCYDYFTNWLGHDFNLPTTVASPVTVAKAAYFHALFLSCACFGMMIPRGRLLARFVCLVPEPTSELFYIIPIIMLTVIGLLPYALFTTEGFFSSLLTMMTAGRSQTGLIWTTGRTGNLNFNWGGYIAQMLQMGQIGAQLGTFYALMVTRSWWRKALAWANWSLWLALAFGSGTRGEVVFLALPIMLLLYVKYHVIAARRFKLISVRAYVICGTLMAITLLLVQIQGVFRNQGFSDLDLTSASTKEEISTLRGNTMFSEAIDAYATVPDVQPFFYDSFPGETVLRPLPQSLFWFVIGPIPRALWNDKPIDPAWAWRARGSVAASDDLQGTTISTGLVGNWYFRYGFAGVIEGGLLFGWLLAVAERAFRASYTKAMPLMFSLAMMTWLFRCFRDFTFNELYPIMIGGALLFVAISIERMFAGAPGGEVADVAQ